MQIEKRLLDTPRAIVLAGLLIAAGICAGLYLSRPEMADFVVKVCEVLSTFLLAFVTFCVWRSQLRIEWFTGAMENHSDQMRQMEARKQGIKMIWWDKTVAPFPFEGSHSAEINLTEIYVGIPLRYRHKQPSVWNRWLRGDR